MGTIFSTSFGQSNNGAGISYTVPSGYVAVLRCLTLSNRSTTTNANWQLRIDPIGLIIAEGNLPPIPSPSAYVSTILEMRVVINAGQQLGGLGAVGLDATLSGYLFLL